MGLKDWAKKKAALAVLDNLVKRLQKEGGPMSPNVKQFIEGALAFVAPLILTSVAESLGAGNVIDPKTLLALCLTSLAAYIRTRPKQ